MDLFDPGNGGGLTSPDVVTLLEISVGIRLTDCTPSTKSAKSLAVCNVF